jgi:hypothetical protein
MTEDICPICLAGFAPGQGKRFDIANGNVYHDGCWPFICCSECGYEPGYGKKFGILTCYCKKV